MRRLITLIDALYEHKVLVHVLADAPIFDLFSPTRAPVELPHAKHSLHTKSEKSDGGEVAIASDARQAKVDNIPAQEVNSNNSSCAASDSDAASVNVARLEHDEVTLGD